VRASARTSLACLAAALPVVVSTINGLSEGWVPYGDQGVIGSQAYDVLTSHTPLVGQYSASYHLTGHPTFSLGPLLYWLLALPARIGAPSSLTLAMGLVNAAAAVGVVLLARRRGGTVLMLASAVAVALMCRSLVPETYHDIWNPSAAVLPFTLLIFLCWSVACGEYRLLPITVLVASFVSQCHLTYLGPTVGMLAVTLVGLVLSRRGAAGGSTRRWLLAALVVGAVCWTPPIVDQIEHSPGNLRLVARAPFAHEPKVGWTIGWHAAVQAVGVPPWWLSIPKDQFDRALTVKQSPDALAGGSAVVVLAGLALVTLAGLRRRRADVSAVGALGLVLCAALASVTARTPANAHLAAALGYTLWWGSPAGMFVWLALGWSAVALLPSRLRAARIPRPALASALGVAGALAIGAAVAAAEKTDEHRQMYTALRTIGDRVRAVVPRGQAVWVGGSPGIVGVLKAGLRYELRQSDIRAAFPGRTRWGPWFDLGRRHYAYAIYLRDARREPQTRGPAAAAVRFAIGSVTYDVSATVSPCAPTAAAPRSGAPGSRARPPAQSPRSRRTATPLARPTPCYRPPAGG
jgi:hypothetical protein